jgi:hypothetical protein
MMICYWFWKRVGILSRCGWAILTIFRCLVATTGRSNHKPVFTWYARLEYEIVGQIRTNNE